MCQRVIRRVKVMTAITMNQGSRQAAEILREARDLVDPVLRASIGSLPAAMRRIGGYHLGWWDRHGVPQESGGGKVLRPALVLAAARAAGGDTSGAIKAAAAVELTHNFTLLHDDVMDGDLTRRHRPTAWSVFGRDDAILAGDALQALAIRLLVEDMHPAAVRAAQRLTGCVIELCEGQHEDCAFEGRDEVTLEQCLAMAGAKTGALLGCACALGALYAGAADRVLEGLDAFGREVGLAFQLIDDVLGIWGDPAVTGKPVGADLAARKKSLPVVAALTSGTPAGARLAAFYRTQRPVEGALATRTADLVERAGGRAWAQAQAAVHTDAAVTGLATLLPDSAAAGDLLVLAELITHRNW